MDNTILTQLYLLGIYILCGIIIGLFFDIFRILRKSFKTPDILTYIEDIMFWIITGLFVIAIIFLFNNGEIRSYVIIGICIGILLYILTISKYIINFCVKIITFLKSIITYPIKKFIIKPIYFLVINIKELITKYIKKIQKITYGKKDFKNKCRKI